MIIEILSYLIPYLIIGYMFVITIRVYDKKRSPDSKHDPFMNLLVMSIWPIVIVVGLAERICTGIGWCLGNFSNLIEIISDKIAGK